MTVESLDRKPGDIISERQRLEGFLLATLEQHDGLCLDNEAERIKLAAALAATLMNAAGDSAIHLPQTATSEQDQASIPPRPYTE